MPQDTEMVVLSWPGAISFAIENVHMLRNKFTVEILITYLAAGLSFGMEEYLLSYGSQWSILPPSFFALLFLGLLINSRRSALFLLLTIPALLFAEKQFFLVVFMALPYLFSSNPSI